jgi:16S rRNA (adenine1518-N6/adenine1519-N6)-dimethyltransferase
LLLGREALAGGLAERGHERRPEAALHPDDLASDPLELWRGVVADAPLGVHDPEEVALEFLRRLDLEGEPGGLRVRLPPRAEVPVGTPHRAERGGDLREVLGVEPRVLRSGPAEGLPHVRKRGEWDGVVGPEGALQLRRLCEQPLHARPLRQRGHGREPLRAQRALRMAFEAAPDEVEAELDLGVVGEQVHGEGGYLRGPTASRAAGARRGYNSRGLSRSGLRTPAPVPSLPRPAPTPVSVAPKKSLGQHFLRDPNTIRKIADALGAPPETPVVEIGPGTGALTAVLAERYARLTALEVDARAVAHLAETLPAVDVRQQDVLETDWPALAAEAGAPLWVIGNLPYYITSPILFGLLDARDHLRRAVIMMQKEVAERLVAVPRTKAYGILSVQTQLWSRPKLLFEVSRHVFFPKPDVTSAVVALDFDRPAPDVDSEALRRVVRAAFNQRRKTLRNSLKAVAAESGREVPEEVAGLRAEALAPAEFVALTHALAPR